MSKMAKILAIDDKQDNLVSVSALLKNLIPGCEVLTAQSGVEGIEKAVTELPDTILLDIKMPEMDGFEVCKRLKADERLKAIPVIMLTAIKTDHKSRIKGLEAGADAFLSKPIEESELVAQVNVMLRIRKAEAVLRRERDLLEDAVKERTAQLQEAKEFLENIFRTSADGIMITAQKGLITMVNEAVEKMLGYSEDEIIGKKVLELASKMGEDEEARNLKFIEQLYEKGFVVGQEQAWLRKDGSLINIELSAALLKDTEGNNTGAVATIRDITERKRAAELLRKSEDKYHNLIESADVGIIVSANGRMTEVNIKAEEIYGYSKEELISQSPSILIPEKYRKSHKDVLEGMLKRRGSEKEVFEEEGIKKDGTIFPLEISFALTDAEGKVIIAVMRDVSERKEMQDRLLQSEKLKSLGELAGGIAHDFNNVLSAILGRAQLLKMDIEKPSGMEEKQKSLQEVIRGLDIIEMAAKDGAETVRRIQEFSRRREDDKQFELINLNEVIEHALDFTRVKWRDDAESKGIKISVRKELSPLPLTAGSGSELREVVTNLINNGVDAMPRGGNLTLSTFREYDHICLKVKDTGVGIPKNLRERIFDPFFTTKGVQSTGLGMSVSYGIVCRHRGTITVDSFEGEGTSFTIKLPAAEEAGEEEKMGGGGSVQEGLRRASILVFEDEEPVRELLSSILTMDGHEVVFAADGKQGMEIFKKREFDLVFTDLGMPGMSGWEVAQNIKSINGKVPVILMSGWDVEPGGKSEAKNNGVDFFVNKPFEVSHILKLVQDGMVLKDSFSGD